MIVLNDAEKVARARRFIRRDWMVVLVILLLMGAAWAEDCPAAKPHRVQVDINIMPCTLRGCMGPLKCTDLNANGLRKCWREAVTDCNTCTRPVTVACLTDDELNEARK